MALLLAVVAATMALANAGMMQMMGGQQNMMQGMMGQQGMGHQGMMMVPMGNGGCQQDNNGQMPAGCEIPMANRDNLEEYLDSQMREQQYETQQMAEKIRAQFEDMVSDVTAKKHRYVMSLVTEYVSFCQCASSSFTIYQDLFVDQAKALNITEGIEVWDPNRQPYEAKNEEDARALIFGGLVRRMCESIYTFLAFADQVSQRIPAFQAGK